MIARLGEGYAQDLFPLEEYERRLSLAFEAQSSVQLAALVADVPATNAGIGLTLLHGVRRFHALFGSAGFGGVIELPARVQVRAVLGELELDFSRAQFNSDVTELDIGVVLGKVTIRLPAGVAMEIESGGMFGSFRLRDAEPVTSAPVARVRLVSRAVGGSVTVVRTP